MKLTNKNYLVYLFVFVLILILFYFLLNDKQSILRELNREFFGNKESLKEGFSETGLDWAVYYGYFNDDVNFASKYRRWMNGTNAYNLSSLNTITGNRIIENGSAHQFSIELTGYFQPNVSGYWYFRTTSDDASYLWIGKTANGGWSPGNATVNNGGLHGTVTRQSGPVYLSAGTFYPIRIQMGENWGWYDLRVEWLQPGGGWNSNGQGLFFPSDINAISSSMTIKGLTWKTYEGYMNNDVNFGSRYRLYRSGIALNLHNIGAMTGNQYIENVSFNDGDGYPSRGWYYNPGPSTDNHNWSIELFGYFLPNVTGNWSFFTCSDDASWLWVGDVANNGWATHNALINNGNPHGMQTISNSVYLVQGTYYPIRIQFGEQGGGYGFRVGWKPPNGSWTCNGDGYLFNSPQGELPEDKNDHNYNVYTTTEKTAFITTPKTLLFHKPIHLKQNMAITFMMKLKSGFNWNWQQIMGITPHNNGNDARIFGAWLCPWGNTVHFRTATINDNNAAILGNSDCSVQIPINEYVRFDIIFNCPGDTLNIVTYMTNVSKNGPTNQIANVNLPRSYYSPRNGTRKAWAFTSYNGYNVINGYLKNIAVATGDTPMSINNLKRAANFGEIVGGAAIRKYGNNGTVSCDTFCQGGWGGFTGRCLAAYNLDNNGRKYSCSDTAASIIGSLANVACDCTSGQEGMQNISKEGFSQIGGIGNNGGIQGITPPTDALPVKDAKNYMTIKDSNGKDLCKKSVVQLGDQKLNLISSNGYNFNVRVGSDNKNSGSVPICSPDELYTAQTSILKELNNFNSEYSDYMTYRYNIKHSVSGDTTQPLKYQDGSSDNTPYADKFKGINDVRDLPTYKLLNQDLRTYSNLLQANRAYYPDPETSDPDSGLSKLDPVNLNLKHIDVVKLRNELDTKLFELNNIQNSAYGESKMQMDSSIYVTILWTTLATSLVYFMFASGKPQQ